MQIVENLAGIANRYDAVFCDLWGCLHDGLRPFGEAVEALRGFRKGGGAVVLLTNAPRPRASVERQLDQIGVPRDCWDVIATSGDSARAAMFEGVIGERVWFMGQDHDLTFFEPLQLIETPANIQRVPLGDATGIACLGPFDAHADPEVNRPEFEAAIARGLKLLCANPDIVVDRGESREWCAGALAKLYTEMGGTSLYFGKPHHPVYDLARRRLAALGRDVDDARILCIGDGIITDVKGAIGEGLDSLYITGGLAREETGTTRQPDPDRLAAYAAAQGLKPTYAIGYLR